MVSTFQIAGSMGFKGELRQWEELLRIESLKTGGLAVFEIDNWRILRKE